jgi:hypothetical protein
VEAKGSRRKSDDDFKNKYPFNLFSFISCRLKTLMKQFFKLKWFIFRGNDFRLSSYVAQVEMRSRLALFFGAKVNDKLEEINFSSARIRRVV